MGTRLRWLGLWSLLAAMLMNLLDATVVTVAGPAIRADLGGSEASLQWTAASYPLAMAVGLLTGGRLGDMLGRRTVLLAGEAGFLLTSLACAAAWSPEALIVARVLQGLCAAVMVPQVFGLIRDLFPPHEIGKAFGALGPVIGLSTVLGPIVAGVLVDADLLGSGWRMVFLINLPIAAFGLVVGARVLPRSRGDRTLRLDGLGAALASVGMFLLIFPLVQGRELGWPAWLSGLAVGALLSLGGFVVRQRARSAAGRVPLVELSVLAKRSYTAGVGFTLVFFSAIVGFSLVMSLLLQLGLGFGPLGASLAMAPWAVGGFLGSGFAAATMARMGRRVLHLGLALMVVGLVGTYLVIDGAGAELGGWSLAPVLLVYGLGMGMIFVPLFDIIMAKVDDAEVGSASGLLESFQQLGASLGVAVLGTVFFSTVGIAPLVDDYLTAARQVTLIALGLTLLASLLGFLLPRGAREATTPPAPGESDDPADPVEPSQREPALA
ncbi:MFS transporter [Streptomyces profundus]|uniref:MFS transporter n=1 Tax=Streptomyces profundus TaxID=2867410 RepID=UPI001D166161|nr:MFS transporter [Streptomyces sp. MA3_2.13]